MHSLSDQLCSGSTNLRPQASYQPTPERASRGRVKQRRAPRPELPNLALQHKSQPAGSTESQQTLGNAWRAQEVGGNLREGASNDWTGSELPRRRAGVSPAGGAPSFSERRAANGQPNRHAADNAWGDVRALEQIHGRGDRRTHQQDDELEWDLDAVNSSEKGRVRGPPDFEDRESQYRYPAAKRRADQNGSRHAGQRDMGPPRRFLSHRERVQVQIQANQAMLAASAQLIERTSEQSMSSTAAQRTLQDFLTRVENIVAENEHHLDPVNVSTALQQLASATAAIRLSSSTLPAASRLLRQLICLALHLQPAFKIDAATTAVTSLAKMAALGNRRSPLPPAGSEETEEVVQLLEGLAERAEQRFKELPAPEPHQLAILMWGYSRLGVNPGAGRLFQVVERAAAPLLSQFDTQNLANLMIAAATLDQPLSEPFLESVAQQAVLKMPQATPQGVSNLLWAFAKLTKQSPLKGDLFRSGLNRAAENAGEFNTQNVANTLWAAVAVGHPVSKRTLEILAQAALNDMHNAAPIALASLLSALAKLGANPVEGRLVEAAVTQADKVLLDCNRQSLSNILWAVGSLGHVLPVGLLQRLNGPWAERIMGLFSQTLNDPGEPQNTANILWAFARLRLDPLQGRLFQELSARLEGRTQHFTVQNLSNILLAAATVQRRCFTPALLNAILARIVTESNKQEVCNTLWSLAALGMLRGAAWRSLVGRLSILETVSQISRAEAQQLLMARMALRFLDKEDGGDVDLPEAILAVAERAMKDTAPAVTISGFHEEVSAIMESMGIPHAIEFSSPDGLLSIDIVARCGDGSPLAIQVDGELHFTALPPYRPLGKTVLRNQLLAAKGFRGVGVPFCDWQKLETREKKVTYMTARLTKWGIAPADAA